MYSDTVQPELPVLQRNVLLPFACKNGDKNFVPSTGKYVL